MPSLKQIPFIRHILCLYLVRCFVRSVVTMPELGGISDEQRVPDAAEAWQLSHFSFITMVRDVTRVN